MAPRLVFGAGGVGTTENSFTFTWDTPEKVADLLRELRALGITHLDSAASYPPNNPWNTETLLGQSGELQDSSSAFTVDTKVLVQRVNTNVAQGVPFLAPAAIASSLDKSLRLLNRESVHTFYAHANDGVTPFAEQAAAFDREVKAGRCAQYGLSNYSVTALRAFFAACEEHGYTKPAVYQGMYNALQRKAEEELLPLLRQHSCAFYAYSPLAGGFLTGKVTAARDSQDKDSRLARTRWQGASAYSIYTNTFDKPAMHATIRTLKAACDVVAEGGPALTLQEASLRWLLHHSAISSEHGDGIIFGAKTVDQVHSNVAEMRRGPLPESVRGVVEGMYYEATRKAESL
ncbi:aldo/keto reductase [Ophiostoma piceae UAMH 11346]|uniref:Aldo/keto reductase n=1 Tax=Ophiostoma piceae (strain UAMH 11346) TaxID=1262450 RepID=S3CPN7_OPHP1|nr:aldo/keto reductase [Ophiostoma piceae UAMH 11346]